MVCREEELVLLANGRLSGMTAWRARRHLQNCEACQTTLAALTALGAELRTATRGTPSEALDYHMQTRRYETPARSGRLFSLIRVPAPLVGAMLGLLYGLAGTVQREPQVQATAFLRVTQSPHVENLAEGEQLIRVLYQRLPATTSYATISQGSERFAVDHVGIPMRLVGVKAKEELEDWLTLVENASVLKTLGWTVKRDRQAITCDPLPIPSRGLGTILSAAAVGILLGGLFWLLRLLGGGIPGGAIGALVVGITLGVLGGVARSFTLRQHDQASLTVQFWRQDGTAIAATDECYALVDTNFGPPSSFWLKSTKSMPQAGRMRLVLQFYARQPERNQREAQQWADKLIQSKAAKRLGYKVMLVEPVAMGENLDQYKYEFFFCVLCGTVAGLVMGLFRRR